jgi:putative ABC transport system substrate-binding protein
MTHRHPRCHIDVVLQAALMIVLTLATTCAVHAQEGLTRRIPVLATLMPESRQEHFREALRERGYEEGKNIRIEWRHYTQWDERMRDTALALARSDADLLVIYGTPPVRAVLEANVSKPIIFTAGDPTATGLAASLSKPGMQATGVSAVTTEISGKLMDLMAQLLPHGRRYAYVRNPSNSNLANRMLSEAQQAARALNLTLIPVDARDAAEIAGQVPVIQKAKVDGVIVTSDLVFSADPKRVVSALSRTRLPVIFQDRGFVEAGGLISYGVDRKEVARRMANYVDRVLKGAKPSDLPIEQASKLELVVNLRTAKNLRIKIPDALLLRADEVLQ